MKKIIALLLAAMMLVTLVACTKAPAETTTKAPVSGNDATEGKTPDTTAGSTEQEIVTVKWVTSNDQAADYEEWASIINAYAGPKIGVNIEMVHVDGETLKLMYQTGADYDIIFAPAGDFVNNVNLGAAADIKDLLAETPGLTNLIPQYVWDAVTVNGQVLGVPAYKDVSHSEYFVWTTRFVEEYYPEYVDVHTIKDAYEACVTIRERGFDNGIPYIMKSKGATFPVDFVYDGIPGFGLVGIAYQGGEEFVSVYETPEVKENLFYMDKLYHEGFLNNDCYIIDNVETDEYLLGNAQGWPSASKTAWHRFGDEDTSVSQFEFTRVSTDSCRGSIVVINAASTKKLEALKWLELVNTDTWVRDMYWHGIEGKHWEYVEQDGEKLIKKLTAENGWTYWAYMYGTFFTATREVDGTPWNEIEKLNQEAVPSPAMGFNYDNTNTADTIANLNAIWEQYADMIKQGVDISLLDTAMAELYDAGLQEVIDDINVQFKAWKDAQ